MKPMKSIPSQMFRLQLSGRIILDLVEKGFLEDDEQAMEAVYATARLLEGNRQLYDFSYEFLVTDLDNHKTYTT